MRAGINSDCQNKTGESHSPVSSHAVFLEKLRNPACILATDGNPEYCNAAFSEFFGSINHDARIDHAQPFFQEYRKDMAQAYLSAIRGTERQCFTIIRSPDGARIPLEIYLFPLMEDETVTALLVIHKILDTRLLFGKTTLALISEENYRYDTLHYEFSPLPIIRFNENKEIIKCSRSCEGFLGFSAEEMIQKKAVTCASLFSADSERVKKSVTEIMSGGVPFLRIGEVKIMARDNAEKIANLIIYPILQNNEISAIEIIMEDITKIRELEERINAKNRLTLFGNISKAFLHSLSNSINVIMSQTQLLSQVAEKKPVAEGIHIIENFTQDIINQIRRIKGLLSDKSSTEDSGENIVDIMEDAIEFSLMQFNAETGSKSRKIAIVRKYLSEEQIRTDTKILREIIITILLKVSQFIGNEGTIEIGLKKNTDLTISVKTKKDVEPEIMVSLPASLTLFSGIDVRQAAEKIKVKIIEEESTDNYAIKAVIPSKFILDKSAKEQDEGEYKIRDRSILIVEDETMLQKIMHDMFDRMGNSVTLAANGPDAFDQFKKNRHDIVIADYGLPGMTGLELAARIRELREDCTIILLSGWILNDIKSYGKIIDLFIPKPFKLDDLIREISKILMEKKK